ncbi:unnamed protein product [Phytophthora fragariaefolia]|uniref:Unnamed protein product n=1 Tax=Phytophthora fragariaefolia TaxID=1490495 RepID=A0A9W7D4L7_9STRA|nr:unnamed protein product [Phytophthora fragariaefolia]
MARTKKKRTREEIEQAMRDNERVNATPAAPDEPAAKKRRLARRRRKRYNLNKGFQALAVDTAQASTAAAGLLQVPAAIPPPTPAYVPAHIPTPVLALASVAEQQRPNTHPAQGRRRRASLPASQQERARTRDRERARARRANRTLSQQVPDRRRDAERKRVHKPYARLIGFVTNKAEKRRRLNSRRLDRSASETVNKNDGIIKTVQEAEAERAASREYQASLRDIQDDEENEEARQNRRTYRGTVRRCHALTNHEDFRVSMLSGPDIVDGRHKLPPTTVGPRCNAWKWPAESKKACWLEGAVQLPPLALAPPRMLQLYGDVHFRRLIRAYNQVFAFTSIGASCSNPSFNEVNQHESVAGQHGVNTYRIQGAMGHYLGSLLPCVDPQTNQPKPAKFAQIYIVDPDMQQRAERRRGSFADLDPGTLLDIEQMMTEVNPFAQPFLNFAERLRQDQAEGKDVVDMVHRLHEKRSNPQLGWTYTDMYANNIEKRNKREMSLREHVAYRLYQKVDDQSVLHQGGRLFQQYCVDQRAKCEQKQLRWIATYQAELRADQYCGFQDALLCEKTVELGEGEALLSEYNRETGTL